MASPSNSPLQPQGGSHVLSPPNSPTQLYGASRTSGGLFRGHAMGNVFNYDDLKDFDVQALGPVKGKVRLYVSDQNPATIMPSKSLPSMTFKQEVFPTLAPILVKAARSFSPI